MPPAEDTIATSELSVSALSSLPEYVDLSTDLAFPAIGDQGDMNSCAGWATTYYQFTYEVNKLKGTAARDDSGNNIVENVYSPSWTYNYINGGKNVGVYIDDAYDILKNQGSMTLADFPYNGTKSGYSFAWSSNIEKMIEALEYRAIYHTSYASTSDEIAHIKERLASGHLFVVWTNKNGWTVERNSAGQYVVVRGSDHDSSSGGHFMTIVGYDDDIEITVNNTTLKGAFKLANSWGTAAENHNNGYIWVAYDALNSTSNSGVSGNGNRTRIFAPGGEYPNYFYYIDVYECEVSFAGYVEYNSIEPHDIMLYASAGSSVDVSQYSSDLRWDCELNASDTLGDSSAASRFIVFDYFSIGAEYDLNDYLSNYWTVKINDSSVSTNNGMRVKVTDNFGNVIAPSDNYKYMVSNGSVTRSVKANLAKGRVTSYDNSAFTTEDTALIMEFITRKVEFSNLQIFLADYNGDGAVSLTDVTAMNRIISARNGETYSITDEVEGWGCSLADVIEEEFNIPIEQYVAENYEELSAMNVIPLEMESNYIKERIL